MGLLDLFGKKEQTPRENRRTDDLEEFEIYSGMRVEVTALDGRLLFVAKLLGLQGKTAELHQYSEAALPQTEDALPVRIRGYNDRTRKAVYMEGSITPMPKHIWRVEALTVARAGNDRAFFRLSTNLDATVTMFSGLLMGEKPCKMLNISVGGAYIRSEYQYHMGDKFLLKVKLMKGRPESAMFCQVLRIIDKEDRHFEYGCQFLELREEDQSKIIQNIFAVQRQQRERS